jgi:beta-ureidopropionase / N-carbamoyl-L-amino-acid hydrolase
MNPLPETLVTLHRINTAPLEQTQAWLAGLYEHSAWIPNAALAQRPFVSVAQLQWALVQVVEQASPQAQLDLIRAHPELAGKALVDKSLTAASAHEQNTAGLHQCSAAEFAQLQQLNRDYLARFGFPFILAVRGPRGTGLGKHDILTTFARRLHHHPDVERAECLRNIHRIAELRLFDLLGQPPTAGNTVWDWHETLAQFSEPAFAAQGQLTVTYLSDAHRACAAHLQAQMLACGFDSAHIDAVGNVVACYQNNSNTGNKHTGYSTKTALKPKKLLLGSHFDTVRNAGKYDGRLGIFVPMAVVQALHQAGKRLPFDIELVAFAEEEGQRFPATFLSSSALTGNFQEAWLAQTDVQGISLRQAMQQAGLNTADIAPLKRKSDDYLGFVEIHIEQGPVLNALNLPLGIVTSINASVRFQGQIMGTASHAGTTPMGQRRDAAAAAAELVLAVERLASATPHCVGTVGMLQVPAGSVNVVAGRCDFSLDLRAPLNAQRDQLASAVVAELEAICQRRGLHHTLAETLRASAAPSHPTLQARWEAAVQHLGLPLHRMPSGAGHDAMQMHTLLPQAMLFVRGQNAGISHNPLESTTSADMQLAVEALTHFLQALSTDLPPHTP